MICYLDITFCNNPNCTCSKDRKLTPLVLAAARKWWGSDLAAERQRIQDAPHGPMCAVLYDEPGYTCNCWKAVAKEGM